MMKAALRMLDVHALFRPLLVLLISSAVAMLSSTTTRAQQPTPPAASGAPAAAPTPPAPVAQPTPPPSPALPREVTDPVERLAKSIETAEKSIQQLKELEGDLQRLRTNVEQIIYDSTATAEQLRPQLAEVKSQIEKLGPPPSKDQPAETPTVAAERARLNALAGALDSAIKTAELAWVRAKQLIDRITVMRYQAFTRNLFERRQSPVTPSFWREVGDRMPTVLSRTAYYGNDWSFWAVRKSGTLVTLVAGIALVGGGLWWFVRSLVLRRRRIVDPIPNFFDRVAAAAWIAPLRILVPSAMALALYSGLDALDLLFSPWEHAAEALIKGVLVFIATVAVARTVLEPAHPAWRLIPVDDVTARRLVWSVIAFVAIYIVDTVLTEFGRAIYVPLNVTVAQTAIANFASAGVLAATLLTPFIPQIGPLRPVNHVDRIDLTRTYRSRPLWVKLPLWAIAIAIVVASLLGYVALGRFLSHQVVLTGAILAVAGLFYLAIRAVTRSRDGNASRVGAYMENRFRVEPQRQGQISKLLEFTLSLMLFIVAVPLLLLQWGFASADIRDWTKAALFGFEIGNFKISLARILFGVALFTVLLFLTRLVQKILREQVLAQGRVDSGIANSVETAVGYGGTILAALIAVSFAGFDITNLAIVAGALSVGIGFGLQSIVNNFVSGLILLIERPIKVGDWIVVGDQQGNVRRISVRSTEIETFEKASIIVPNSELISGRVFNWTHRNLLGRVVIKVSVDPTADPDRMVAMLRAAAQAQPLLMTSPEPSVGLDYFGSDKLEFSLRATLSDVNQGAKVQSDLRLAILRGCRDMGVIASMMVPTPAQQAAPPLPPSPAAPPPRAA